MVKDSFMRRVRGAIGNAVVWGACWGALTVVTLSTLKLIGAFGTELIWLDIVGMAIRIGIFGGVASGAFSFLLPFFYRRKRLADINWVKFGLVGGAVTGVFVPVFLQSMSLLTGGEPIAWNLINTDVLLGAVFGAVTAGGSLRLAQHAERKSGNSGESTVALDSMRELEAGNEADLESALRSRSMDKSNIRR
jgi:hypothetical protein